MITGKILSQLVMAFLGSAGFAILFHLRKKFLWMASFGGFISWFVYLIADHEIGNLFFATLMASAAGALYAEILARVLKAPSTPFFIVSAIPLIPGSTLYFSMSQVVYGHMIAAGMFGMQTMQCALGIAAGMSLVWAMCDLTRKIGRTDILNRGAGE